MPARNLSDTHPAPPAGTVNIKWQIDTSTGETSGYLPSGGSGVTSVGLSAPAEFTVSGSPVTTAGTLTFAKAAQAANLVYIGPASGAAAAPTFRALTAADLPAGTGIPAFVRETPTGTMDGVNTAFTVSFSPNPGASLTLYLNGIEQIPTIDYSITGTTVTYTVAPKSTDLMIAQYTH